MDDLRYRELVAKISALEVRIEDMPRAETGGWRLIFDDQLISPAATITIPSTGAIPQTYRGLALVTSLRGTASAENRLAYWRINGDSTNTYDAFAWEVRGDATIFVGVGRPSSAGYIGYIDAATARANNYPPNITYFWDYTHTDREKWGWTANTGTFGNVSANADMRFIMSRSRWRHTDSITSITLVPESASFATGSRYSLYGIL